MAGGAGGVNEEGETVKAVKASNEQRYYDALKRITSYKDPDWIHGHPDKTLDLWGLNGSEAIAAAYENVIGEAKAAIRCRRRPQ